MSFRVSFKSNEHEKARFIHVSINTCKDVLKNFFHSHTVSLDKVESAFMTEPPQHPEVLEAVLSLPQNYRTVIYLYYYEGYKETEIADILKKKVNTIYTWMYQAKQILKKQLGGE
ncbi:sigma factor-like helix-turn-helix DNA-binding protein [Faecalicoccus pleomorphus]|uniref:sigma factor-like helix-turn-helix DNA-binding protein n=1 Tax=Faecalicoccus pleomorphus TaxID=1323 RepID=UPI00232C0A75|nr:sigma factor-like helix-turn-helix DNA-binding protein [Faecalicoccus pleomorphus]